MRAPGGPRPRPEPARGDAAPEFRYPRPSEQPEVPMPRPDCTIVLDIGKTNAKLALVDAKTRRDHRPSAPRRTKSCATASIRISTPTGCGRGSSPA